MNRLQAFRSLLVGGASILVLGDPALAREFNVPRGDLASALDVYIKQADVQIIYSDDAVRGRKSAGAKGNYTELAALDRVLSGTGFKAETTPANAIGIVPDEPKPRKPSVQVAANTARPAGSGAIETVTVTAQKVHEDIQTVPISVTALSQKQLTERQIAGGPDLIKEVPNLTFSKTNFTGYNLEIRGIGTQAISVTTDPAVAVAFNGTPFLRNHFFEQEFYDVSDVEVLRGPQGTLYGRNATAGVVDLRSALPTGSYEAMASVDFGNFGNRRLEGMVNIPIVGDTLGIRVAGEWTKRDGYTTDTTTNTSIDGRDLWSGRVTIGWKPSSSVESDFVWEHFSEDDDRLRSGKQLCKTDFGPGEINGVLKPIGGGSYGESGDFFTQGCLSNVSLYSPQAFETPIGFALPYVLGLGDLGKTTGVAPYDGVTQSTNLRSIESEVQPHYLARNDTLEWNTSWQATPTLSVVAQTGYNRDFLFSSEDYNRFGSNPGIFLYTPQEANLNNGRLTPDPAAGTGGIPGIAALFCDPQVGCSDSLIVEDLSTEHAWQLSQEFRATSSFSGPFNFTAGANYLHYETLEKYYVFSNALTLINENGSALHGFQYNTPTDFLQADHGYVDPNSIFNLNDQGHNYFLSENPYVLNSYAAFADANYKLTKDFTVVGGLRWTDDQKHFQDLPSWVATDGYGYPVTGVVDQQWERLTGRAVVNWTPQLDFTDQTLFYASYSHGYKAGGANPPGAKFIAQTNVGGFLDPVHPLTFKPEYIEAFELGSKNTLLDGAMTLNADVFYYNYTGYQISEIVDRTAINNNYNAHVEGAELEATWEPLAGLKFNFAGGYETSGLAGGDSAVDLMDRTAGVPGWYVVKPFVTEASNCIFPAYVAQNINFGSPVVGANAESYCSFAYQAHVDPLTGLPYVPNPTVARPVFGFPAGYPGFDPSTAPNNGEGFSKNLQGKQLPNAPHFTASLTGEYTMPVSQDWAATVHADFYFQSSQWARVFEDPIDFIKGYTTTNLSVVMTSADGWQVMGYVKNVFDVTSITGTFLNSDDTGLTTNVFLTDPRLFGVRVTKHLDEGDGIWGSEYSGSDLIALFSDTDNGKPPLWIELGGGFDMLADSEQPLTPPFFSALPAAPLTPPVAFQHAPGGSFDYDAKLSYQPEGSDWVVSAAVRYGRSGRKDHEHQQLPEQNPFPETAFGFHFTVVPSKARYTDSFNTNTESHAIFDFAVGQDVGIGLLGSSTTSNISAGVRLVHFTQASDFSIHADPFSEFKALGPKYWYNDAAEIHAHRSFLGAGPSLSWKGSVPVAEMSDTNGFDVDWGVNGAILFGRQVANGHHQTTTAYVCTGALNGCQKGVYSNGFNRQTTKNASAFNRRRMVAVPNIGGFAGVSWRYNNAKVSFGYRADEFFGAMDGGIDAHKSQNLGLFGPYAKITIGLGG